MNYDSIINELFARFSLLRNAYENEGDYIRDLPHLCYEIVFVPFIRQVVLANDISIIQSICSFTECMANSDDEKVSELLAVSVLESLLSEREIITSLKPYMGAKTLKVLSAIEKEYGWS